MNLSTKELLRIRLHIYKLETERAQALDELVENFPFNPEFGTRCSGLNPPPNMIVPPRDR